MQKLVCLFVLLLAGCSFGAYNESMAFATVFLSYSAFCPTSQLSIWDCYFCDSFTSYTGSPFTVTAFVNNDILNLFSYIGYSGNTAYVIFRATQPQSAANILTDLNILPIPYLEGRGSVHAGFYSNWETIKDDVGVAIRSLVQQDHITEVYFTGHSLGAALTTLAALEVGTTLGKPLYVYTFGGPRVGDEEFVSYWNSLIPPTTSYRIVHNNDIVPQVPPTTLGFYKHVPTEVWYRSATNYKVCNDASREDRTCSASVNPLLYSLTDHGLYLGQNFLEGDCIILNTSK